MDSRIADTPDAMQDAIFVGNFSIGGACVIVENLFHAAGGIGVKHEDLAEVGAGGLEQVEAIAFGLGERLLVAEDHLVGIFMKAAEGDEAAAFFDLVGSGDAEALGVGEDAGIAFLDENGLFAPCLEIAAGAGVDALASLGIKKFGQSQNNADQVVGAALVISLLHGR